MKSIAIVGLMVAIFTFLTGVKLNPHFDTFENAARICAIGCVTLSGMLPAMLVISRLAKKPLQKFGAALGISSTSALALLGSIVTNATTFGVMNEMDKKGIVLNSAFAVSASFALGGHLAYTMAYDADYALPMIVAKLVSGIAALALALALYGRFEKGKAS